MAMPTVRQGKNLVCAVFLTKCVDDLRAAHETPFVSSQQTELSHASDMLRTLPCLGRCCGGETGRGRVHHALGAAPAVGQIRFRG